MIKVLVDAGMLMYMLTYRLKNACPVWVLALHARHDIHAMGGCRQACRSKHHLQEPVGARAANVNLGHPGHQPKHLSCCIGRCRTSLWTSPWRRASGDC